MTNMEFPKFSDVLILEKRAAFGRLWDPFGDPFWDPFGIHYRNPAVTG